MNRFLQIISKSASLFGFAFAFAFCLALTSCQSSIRDLDDQVDTTKDFLKSQFYLQEVLKSVHFAMSADSAGLAGSCIDSMWTNSANYPMVVSIEYGSSACSRFEKSGVLKVELNSPYLSTGGMMIVHLDELMIDGTQLAGAFTSYFESTDSLNLGMSMQYDETHFRDSLPGYLGIDNYLFEGDGYCWIQKDTPGTYADDNFSFTMAANGRDTRGVIYTAEVVDNLMTDYSCAYASNGGLQVKASRSLLREVWIDECSSEVRVTINNSNIQIDLAN